jgi:hypothetical protein
MTVATMTMKTVTVTVTTVERVQIVDYLPDVLILVATQS